ncbi:MAG: reverse transcriptase domain-containing protein, partial [Sedimenticola sp.]
MSSCSYLSKTLTTESIDICGISEHWLYEHDLHFLDCIDKNYSCYAKSDFDLGVPGNRRVGKGGVCLMWRKQFDHRVSRVEIDDDRIIGIQCEFAKGHYLYVFQVYLPCTNYPIYLYREYIDNIYNMLSMYKDKGLVIIMGDFNAHLNGRVFIKPLDDRGHCLLDFLSDNNMISVNATNLCTGAESTFVTYDGRHESFIDHIIISQETLDTVKTCTILDDSVLNVSRHRPIVCDIGLPTANTMHSQNVTPRINWKKADITDKCLYSECVTKTLESCPFLCTETYNTENIDRSYDNLVQTMLYSSDLYIPKSSYKHFLKPYWNSELKQLHDYELKMRRLWIHDHKPRGHEFRSYFNYKEAKRRFRSYHRKCIEGYISQLDADIDTAAEMNSAQFWKLYNTRRKSSCNAAGSEINFNGQVLRDPEQIANGWGTFFAELYSVAEETYDDQTHATPISERIRLIRHDPTYAPVNSCPPVTISNVKIALKQCNKGKASGEDQIDYEHLMYGGDQLCKRLSVLYSSMIYNSYTPANMKRGKIITLHKGGKKRKDDPNNYRAITLSSTILKVFERILYNKIIDSNSNQLSSLQGGFQKGMGCTMTSFLLRESIHYAKEQSSKLYVCFLDVQKAFDTVWHDALFHKLDQMNVDPHIIRLLISMYDGAECRVAHNGYSSDWFPVLRGTKQGGVISPFLYLAYIDGLLRDLQSFGGGFVLYDHNCSCPTVADDMCLLSLSMNGLADMMHMC